MPLVRMEDTPAWFLASSQRASGEPELHRWVAKSTFFSIIIKIILFMKKIKIYTLSDQRPDLIPIQYESIKKYIKDDFEYIVLNNAHGTNGVMFSQNNEERKQKIFEICDSLKVKCLEVLLEDEFQYFNGYLNFDKNSPNKYPNPNFACSYPIMWLWERYITEDESISVIIDSDMFFIKEISISEMMSGYNCSFIPHYRDSMKIGYPWNGFVIVDPSNMPNPKELNWGCGRVNDVPVDVGGLGYFYLKKYNNNLNILYLTQLGLCEDYKKPFVVTSINGCFGYDFDFDKNEIILKGEGVFDGAHIYENKIFPHENEIKDYFEKSTDMMIDMIKIIENYNFPKPTFVDLIKVESGFSIKDSFIFHYKAASNYCSWADEIYNKKKTQSLIDILDKWN